MLGDMIWVMLNLNNYVGNDGKMNRIIFVLIDLKREIREDTVFVMKAKTHIQNAFQKGNILITTYVVFNLK